MDTIGDLKSDKNGKLIAVLSYLALGFALIISLVGLFYTTGGERFVVNNIYGDSIEMYGDGIYAYNSVMRAGSFKGTDIVTLLLFPIGFILTKWRKKSNKAELLHTSIFFCLLYYSMCLVFGVSFNRMFHIYAVFLGLTLFTFILSLRNVLIKHNIPELMMKRKYTGTAIFLFVAGAITMAIWLMQTLPAVISGNPSSILEIYTTEPTYAIDFALTIPMCFICGWLLLKKNPLGIKFAIVLLVLLADVGLIVIGQLFVQVKLGVEIPLQALIGMIISFVILGSIAIVLEARILKIIK